MNYKLTLVSFAAALALLAVAPILQTAAGWVLHLLGKLARKPVASSFVIAVFALLVCILPSIIWWVPRPVLHDEFAYLLMGDTFAHGRLANPPHPMWRHFETFHVIQQPTYAAKFPVGQGLTLALGQMFSLPILGVWLTIAAACIAIRWMLRPLVGLRWSLVGALLTPILPVIQWWSQCYWGGGVAMLGGALVVGSAMRLQNSWRNGIIAGIGAAILANSRPFEGLILCAIVAACLRLRVPRRMIVGALAVLLPVVAWMGYYNMRVTGSWTTLPYALHAKQYMRAPLFFWQSPAAPITYNHEAMRSFYEGEEYDEYARQTTLHGFINAAAEKIHRLVRSVFYPFIIAIPLITLPSIARRRRMAMMLAICLLLPPIHMICTPWMRAQYLAPMLGCIFAIVVGGMRRLWMMRFGKILVPAILIAELAAAADWGIGFRDRPETRPFQLRAQMIAELEKLPGKHLILVKYPPDHWSVVEFVFNDADIDGSKVVFARHMNAAEDRELLEYFQDRSAWELDLSQGQGKLVPLKQTPEK